MYFTNINFEVKTKLKFPVSGIYSCFVNPLGKRNKIQSFLKIDPFRKELYIQNIKIYLTNWGVIEYSYKVHNPFISYRLFYLKMYGKIYIVLYR